MPEQNKLTQVETHEVSLVRRGANGKKFALTKGLEMNEVIEAVIKTEIDGEQELIESLGDVSEDQAEIAKAAFRLQVGFQDKLSTEQLSQVAKTALGEDPGEEKPAEDGEEKPAEEGEEKPAEEGEVEKSAEVSEEIQKQINEKEAQLAALQKSADESALKVVELEKAALRKTYVEKAEKDFSHIAGISTEDMADLLMDLAAVSPELVNRVSKTWTATGNEKVLKQVGRASTNDGVSVEGPLEELRKHANGIAEERGISRAKAMDIAVTEKPELYRAYKNPEQA